MRRLTYEYGLAATICFACAALASPVHAADPPDADPLDAVAKRWLGPQEWRRDTAAPILSLGPAGSFDSEHIHAPAVALENGRYRMWYVGSEGTVADRV